MQGYHNEQEKMTESLESKTDDARIARCTRMYAYLLSQQASKPASCLSCLSCLQCLSLETGKMNCTNRLSSYAKQKIWLRECVFDMFGLQPPGDQVSFNVKRLLFPGRWGGGTSCLPGLPVSQLVCPCTESMAALWQKVHCTQNL